MKLTPRETEILEHLPYKTYGEIGTILGISERTVINHTENIKRKLKASSKTHLVAIAVARGIITISMMILMFISLGEDDRNSPRYKRVSKVRLIVKSELMV